MSTSSFFNTLSSYRQRHKSQQHGSGRAEKHQQQQQQQQQHLPASIYTSNSPHQQSHSAAPLPPEHQSPLPPQGQPTTSSFPSTHFTLGAGVAIFHLATARVVICSAPVPSIYDHGPPQPLSSEEGGGGGWLLPEERYHFLPKGRLDVNESPVHAAEREGFEESGYRNRVLPLPLRTRQTRPVVVSSGVAQRNTHGSAVQGNDHAQRGLEDQKGTGLESGGSMTEIEEERDGAVVEEDEDEDKDEDEEDDPFIVTPVWVELCPVSVPSPYPYGHHNDNDRHLIRPRREKGQYILQWFIAETLPPAVEASMNSKEIDAHDSITDMDALGHSGKKKQKQNVQGYRTPPAYPKGFTTATSMNNAETKNKTRKPRMTLEERIALDRLPFTLPQLTTNTNSDPSAQQTPTSLSPSANPSAPQQQQQQHQQYQYNEPQHHTNTGTNAEEATYQSALLPIEDAIALLNSEGSHVQADVVRMGWEAVLLRMSMEVEQQQ